MFRHKVLAWLGLVTMAFAAPVSAADPDRDFSGKWTLDPGSSRMQALEITIAPSFTIVQQESAIHCSTNESYALDGSETKYRIGDTTRTSAVKWEGSALLINTLVSGPRDYTVMDRWTLTPDHATLTITRQVMQGTWQTEGVLVYRGEGWQTAAPRPMLTRPEPRAPQSSSEVTVPAGTHIALALSNTVDTKHSREGDRIYLETIAPIASDGRIVIPRGSFVNGTVTRSKPAIRGKVKSKGELYIRFDSITLPSGASRDFRSRPSSAEGAKVDREEGKVTGERDTARDVGQVAGIGAMGASLGGLIGASSGHALKGVGVGGAAGAAAGLASVLLKKGPDATLRKGTTMEMVLDRDISFTAAELRW
jgi:hypothetical protein